jgi:hypothetical protein
MNITLIIAAIILVVGGVGLTVVLSAAIFKEKNKAAFEPKEQAKRAA